MEERMNEVTPTARTALPLDAKRLPTIAADGRVAVPRYDRTRLVTGIVHVGVGGFHRAHQALTIDRLLSQGQAEDFAICGVGLLPQDERMADVLRDQDFLYTLMLKHPDGGREAQVIGSIVDFVLAARDREAVIERMARPETRIVSLTITEGGYNVDPTTGAFLAEDPAVRHDLAHPDAPVTVFGFVTAALVRRRARGVAPFAVLSCDNLPHNGAVARNSFVSFARLVDQELGNWVAAHVSFPSSMVDRVTPVTTEADREDLRARFGIEDRWPVVAEPFFQWVIEDDFPAGRPPFNLGGAELVRDVAPYEAMKLRCANCTHQAICYFGTLLGYRYGHEALEDPRILGLVRRYLSEEALPTLTPIEGVGFSAYAEQVIARFANPEIADTLARIRAFGSDRIPKWLLPVVRDNLAADRSVQVSAAICASWARYHEGRDERGEPIEIVDRLQQELAEAARAQRERPTAFLENRELFGDLVDDPRFREPYLATLEALHRGGVDLALRQLVGS
jgi:mannitol 2-dehydrogenase